MLFEILLFVYLVCIPFVMAYLVVWSLKQLRTPKTEVEMPIPKKKRKAVLSKEEQRTMDILANIDRYDGTSYGQKPIK